MLERIRFMKVNRNKQFEYTPRYYNERRERIEKMKAAHKNKNEGDAMQRREALRDRLQNTWAMDNTVSNHARSANIRLIVILVALLAGTYFILDYVDIFAAEVTKIQGPEK
ncbi:MAG: hypothetical protein ACQERC_09450 [Bacteroidota bacterium]